MTESVLILFFVDLIRQQICFKRFKISLLVYNIFKNLFRQRKNAFSFLLVLQIAGCFEGLLV